MENVRETMEQGTKKTVLVTGATGFLGEYLTARLVKEYHVLALGRNAQKGRKLEEMGAVFCPGDFTDAESCAKYFKGASYVIHAGALSTVWGEWEDFYRTNVLGTDTVARLCDENQVCRLVYISSPSIYTGKYDRFEIKENQVPAHNELNYYIRSKLMAEQVIRRWNRRGLETVILRPRGLIGIGDTSLVPRLLRANKRTGIPLMRGGHNIVDLTSVENAALACRLAMTAPGADGGVFNITNGEPMEFKSVLEHFLEAIGERPRYRRLPFRAVYGAASALEWAYRTFRLPGEPPLTRYTVCTLGFSQTMDIGRAERILGYKPEKTLAESIREYGRWWKETQVPPGDRMEEGPGAVGRVRLYHCGFCTNNLRLLFRGQTGEKRDFPASAALIHHKNLGNILFDTGYSGNIFKRGFPLNMYRLLNPVTLEPGQTIAEKLEADGISLPSVKTIILSHAHPDHIGGMPFFKGYHLIASDEVLKSLEKPKLKNLVFSGLVPEEQSAARRSGPGNRLSDHFLCRYFDRVYDLFGDGSIIGVILEGHCRGQMGIWIPDFKLLLAADACWGGDLVRLTGRMRLIPRLIQESFPKYRKTLESLCRLKRDYPEIRILFTHQTGKEKTYG